MPGQKYIAASVVWVVCLLLLQVEGSFFLLLVGVSVFVWFFSFLLSSFFYGSHLSSLLLPSSLAFVTFVPLVSLPRSSPFAARLLSYTAHVRARESRARGKWRRKTAERKSNRGRTDDLAHEEWTRREKISIPGTSLHRQFR